MIEGTWPEDCVQRAFVEGVKYALLTHHGFTIFPSERDEAEAEAVRRYGEPDKKKDYSGSGDPYGIEAVMTAQSAAVDVRGNTVPEVRGLPTQAEADAIKLQAN